MKPLSQRVSLLLFLAVDGTLDENQKRELEELLAANPEVAQELRERKALKELLHDRRAVSPNPYFWTRLSQAIDAQKEEERNLLPFPRKYLPVASAMGILAFVALGVTVFVQREPLLQYLSERSAVVQEVYESSILKGAVMPLFANIGNDDVLQYALFGTLPLDKESETALRVDEGIAEGYRIEVGLTGEQVRPRVTVHELLEEVRPSMVQAVKIDSVLGEARKLIEQAVFYSENNALAIDPELTRLNRVVLTRIAAVLAPAQRDRFDKFLQRRNASYAIAAGHRDTPIPPDVPMGHLVVPHQPKDFIVITPDSFTVAVLNLNVDSIMRPGTMVRTRFPDMERKLEMLMRSRAVSAPSVHQSKGLSRSPVRVVGETDMIKIELDAEFMAKEAEEARVVVQPRGQRDKFFRFEFRTGVEGIAPVIPESPEVSSGIRGELDSMMRQLQREQETQVRELMRMDSVFKQGTQSRPRRQSAGVWVDSLK
ncbi:MAG: hypothetical protein WEB33_11010 [Bacteroidota bacterium]